MFEIAGVKTEIKAIAELKTIARVDSGMQA